MTWLDDLTLDTVVVHLTTGRSLKGNKRSVYDDSIVLADARVLMDEGMSQMLNGEVILPRERVEFIQTVPPEAT
jgi:hypothetical protein